MVAKKGANVSNSRPKNKLRFPEIPSLQGVFEPWPYEGEIHDLVVKGNIPDGLRGTYYRNGPNPQYVLNDRYHAFDGDGMIHAIEFSDERIRYVNKWVKTEKLDLERQAGRSLFGGIANQWRDPSVLDRSGNVANTSVLWHAGRLFALYEGGLPIEVHPQTLATLGEWNFEGKLDRFMTAHPKIDPETGELLFYSYAGKNTRDLVFYCADQNGKITQTKNISTPYCSAMNHDFVITENYVIFSIFPLTFNMDRILKGQFPIAWEPERGTWFGVMSRKQASDEVTWFKTDASFVFHYMNAFEEQGEILVDALEVHSIPKDAKPFQSEDEYPTQLTRWKLCLQTRTVTKHVLDTTPRGEMPRIDERFCGRSYNHGYFVAALDESKPNNCWNAIVHVHHSSKTRHVYCVPDGDIVNEAVFVPKSEGREGEGYLLSLVYREAHNRSDLLVLDAMKVDQGPIAIVELPHRVPFGFHGCWMQSGMRILDESGYHLFN